MTKIQLTKTEIDEIQGWVDVSGSKEAFLDYHISRFGRYEAAENLFLNDLKPSKMAQILYVSDSYEILETEEEKLERWSEFINKSISCNAIIHSKVLLDFAKDFNINLKA